MTESKEYLTRQLITYIGNKRALIPFILEAVGVVRRELGGGLLAFGDLFSGSGVVARAMKASCREMYINDLEGYCETLSRCYLSTSSQRESLGLKGHYARLCARLEGPLEGGFISRLYAPGCDSDIKAHDRVFYTSRNARYIDTARGEIEKLPPNVRPYFIAPLLCEASVKANTAGVFKGFYKDSRGVGRFGGRGEHALSRIKADISLPFPVFSNFDRPAYIFRRDALELAKELPHLDLVYLDPPYNQHPYGSNYFMLNLVNEYEQPSELSKVSGIPKGWNRSPFNKKGLALPALIELCASIRASYLLISFSSEGFISPESMEKGLSALGSLRIMRHRHNVFRGSRNLKNRGIHNEEYLFLLKKEKE